MRGVITVSPRSIVRAAFSSWPEKLAGKVNGYGYLSVRRYRIAVTIPLACLVMGSSAS
ncbi:hypothetical protein ALQ75_03341 [Pseudomonas savastanoi pv. glycinea]|nr:hypothetical protein ALQ75_03341 [Pseudomonas savastanoi pv. glycinea]